MGTLRRLITAPSLKTWDTRLWFGIDLTSAAGKARGYCETLMREGLLCKDTHEQTIRLAPPLCITKDEIDWAADRLRKVLG